MNKNNLPYDPEKALRFDPAAGRLSRLQFFVGLCAALGVFSVPLVLGLLGPMLGALIIPIAGFFLFISLWMMLTMRFRDVVMKCPFCWASACLGMYILSFTVRVITSPPYPSVLRMFWPEILLALILIGVGSLPSKH